MKMCMYNGAMWTYLEYEPIVSNSVMIGGVKLMPGTIIDKIGTKNCSYRYAAGDMIYCGYVLDKDNRKLLLFRPYELNQKRPSYICFWYEDRTMLTYGSISSPIMVFANELVISKNPKLIGSLDVEVDQVDMFENIS